MLFVYFVFLLSSYGESSLIDQRQDGDFNIQVDVKDVQIFAVMKGEKEEYVVIFILKYICKYRDRACYFEFRNVF